MALALATKMPEFAAIAPVATPPVTIERLNLPQLATPISTLYMVGTKDSLVPLDLLENTVENWAIVSDCSLNPTVTTSPQGVTIEHYKPCNSNSEFLLYIIEGQGHSWPGNYSSLPATGVNSTTNQINATDVIWNFFEKHNKTAF